MEIKKCVLADGGVVKFTRLKGENILECDRKLLKPIDTIIEIEVDGKAKDISPVNIKTQPDSEKKLINLIKT